MDQIPFDEVKFHPHSFGDPDGRLFWWDGLLYRAITHEKAPFFRELFESGLIQNLVERGLLVGSEPTSLALDGYAMVVRHREVPFTSYPQEWCPAMFKHAAITYIELATELAQRRLSLKDTHPWNILFDGCQPVYVDLTSIRTLAPHSPSPPYHKFCRYYLYPLLLMSQGKGRIARCLMPDGVSESDLGVLSRSSHFTAVTRSQLGNAQAFLRRHLPRSITRLLRWGLKPLRSPTAKRSSLPYPALEYLDYLRRKLEAVPIDSSKFDRLSGERVPSLCSSEDTWSAKQRSLHHLFGNLRPRTVLDIGIDTGSCPQLPAALGSTVVAFSPDPAYVTDLYKEARAKRWSILPLIMDFTDATPSRGLASHSSIAATERFRCDLVLALSLFPNIVRHRLLRFDQVVEGLALFAKRWAVVDFRGFGDPSLNLRSAPPTWYTLENLITALKRRFRHVTRIRSYPEPCILLLCEK